MMQVAIVLGTLLVLIVVIWWLFFGFPKRLKPCGKAILVTGAASGLGKQICEDLLEIGCLVYATDRTLAVLETAWKDYDLKTRAHENSKLELFEMDVTKQEQVSAVAKRVEALGNGLFGVVNAAGVAIAPGYPIDHIQGVVELDVDKWVQPVVDINLFGTMRVNHAFFQLILASKGAYINVASVLGHSALAGVGSYSVSKKAVMAYSDTLRRELAPYGVRVGCLAPGFIKTPMTIPVFHPQAVLAPRNYEHTVLQKGRGDEGQFQLISGTWEQLPEPKAVAAIAIQQLFSDPIPPHFIIDNWKPKLFYTLLDFIPTSWADTILDKVRHRNIESYKVYGPKS
jgi:NAD(P)-dependent dehydrogenase (short-subunit alcohol dehydrogenase family)